MYIHSYIHTYIEVLSGARTKLFTRVNKKQHPKISHI